MKIRMASVFVVVAALLASAAPAAPKEAKSQSISLDRPALVGGIVLPAGSYQLEFVAGTDTARFLQRGRTVVELPCKVGFAQVIYPGNAVHYRTEEGGPDRLIKIVFASSKVAIEFPSESGAAQAAF